MSPTVRDGFLCKVGDVEVSQVSELLLPTSVRWLLPEAPRDAVENAKRWLQPHFMDESGYLLQSIHTYLVRTPDLVILIDTGVGNQKQRGGGIPQFNMLETNFLDRLAAAGARPDDVDIVLCTHIHGDHCGWDTHLEDGRRTPTFGRARHVFAEPELTAALQAAEGQQTGLIADSIQPVIDAGLAESVAVDYQVCQEIRLEPSHGHSPGHSNLKLGSRGESAVFIGDAMHSPIQCLFPTLKPALDRTEEPARSARLAILERYADTGTVVFGAHFSAPCGGRVFRDGSAFRFEAIG